MVITEPGPFILDETYYFDSPGPFILDETYYFDSTDWTKMKKELKEMKVGDTFVTPDGDPGVVVNEATASRRLNR